MIRLTWIEELADDSKRETVVFVAGVMGVYTDANGSHHAHTSIGHIRVKETPAQVVELTEMHQEDYFRELQRVEDEAKVT